MLKIDLLRRMLHFEATAGTKQSHEHNSLTKRAAIPQFLSQRRGAARPREVRRVRRMRPSGCDGHGYRTLGGSIRQGWRVTVRRRGLGRESLLWLRSLFRFGTRSEEPPEEIDQKDGRDDECADELFRFHDYFFWRGGGSSSVSAMASRIAVSACTFFMR
jgi:hypothetical protein